MARLHSLARPAPVAPAPAGGPARRSVAVLGFKNLSGNPEVGWLSTALADMLTTELAAGGRLRTIPGENVGRMKMELSLSDAESLARDTLAKVGKNLGTDTVLLGSYLSLGDQIRLDMRVQDVAAGETVASMAESGTARGLVDLVTRAGTRLRLSMGVEQPPVAEAHALAAGAPSNLEAQRLYGEGLAKLRLLDGLAARDLLQQAVAADPRSPMAHVALADAWTMLGYDARAKEEAQRAFDLGARLGREDRLSVEARYREVAGEWAKAVEIHGALLAFFPDSVEYGLRLAAAQSAAGRGADALATLARLRELTLPSANDPRIDLSEAAVAQSLGDYRRELAAASRAAVKGEAQGARLLVARARLREEYALDRLGEFPKAAAAAEQARQIYADAKDQGGLARALNAIGGMAWDHGDLERARATWEEALAIRRQIGYRYGVAASLHNLGLLRWEQGDLAGARRNLEEGYAIDRELGDRSEIAIDLQEIAGLLAELGDLPGAAKTVAQAQALASEIGAKSEAALIALRRARITQAQGDLADAEKQYRAVLPVLHERGVRDYVAEALYLLGDLLETRDDLPAARKSHDDALSIRRTLKAEFTIAKSQVALGRLSIEEGHPESAEEPLRSAVSVFSAQKAADWEASAHAVIARARLALRRPADAAKAIEPAMALAARSRSPHVRLTVATTVARVRAASGRMEDALHGLEAALGEATRLGLVGDQLEIRLAQGEIALGSGRAGSADLGALARDARSRGFALVARKAETILASRAAPRGGGS